MRYKFIFFSKDVARWVEIVKEADSIEEGLSIIKLEPIYGTQNMELVGIAKIVEGI